MIHPTTLSKQEDVLLMNAANSPLTHIKTLILLLMVFLELRSVILHARL